MLVQTQVGPIATIQSISAGLQAPARSGNLGDTIVSELHGRYYETTYRRAGFSASATGFTQSSTGVPATGSAFTGAVLVNPPGNTFNMVLNKFNVFHSVAPTAGVIGLARGYGLTAVASTTAPAAPGTQGVSRYAGGAAPTGSLYIVATLTFAPLAIVSDVIQYSGATLITTTPQTAALIDLEGGLILPPGSFASVYLSAASGTSGLNVSAAWEEVPV